MYDSFDFIGGILLGAFIGSLVTLVYHVRQIRNEARQNYVRLSLAHSEVATLNRALEIHRRNPVQNGAVREGDSSGALPLVPSWMSRCESPIADGTTPLESVSQARETES